MRCLLLIATLIILTSCGSSQTNDNIFIDKGNPEKVGIDAERIKDLIAAIKDGKIKNIHGLLLIKDNYLIAEEYFGDFNRNQLHYTASVSKSFASALLGIAIDKGFFNDNIQTVLNKNVATLFPEYANLIEQDSLKRNLKLKHILSMTAGFDWDEHTYPYSDNRNDCNRINNSRDPMKFLFARKLIHKPGTEFYYNGGLSLSISYLLSRSTKMRVDKFAEKYLFKTLDIKNYQWERVANGLIDTDGGLHLKPIDQAKLGYLFLNKGLWKNHQAISGDWINTSTQMHRVNQNMPDYGYQWWGGDFGVKNQTVSMYMASGHGGQKIVVIPSFNVVVVISQQVFDNQFGDLNFIAIMSDYILPALMNQKPTNKLTPNEIKDLHIYEGHFVLEDKSEFIEFKVINNTLVGFSSDGQENTFTLISDHLFKTRVMDLIDIYIKFIPDPSSKIEGLKSHFAFTNKTFYKDG